MAEYIEREALLQSILDLPSKMDEDGYGWLGRRGVWQMALDFPAADVRPVVRGKWLDDWETGFSECSVCHDSFLWEDFKGVADWNFCPNCGAMMEES